MGIYVSKGNDGFIGALNGEYVDKTGMISIINSTLETERRFSCVTRSRRFGKSMAARMLNAYYDESCDSHSLFEDLEISKSPSYGKHLNKYPVIYLDITDFTTKYQNNKDIILRINQDIISDITNLYPRIVPSEGNDLMDVLIKVCQHIGKKFIMIIDEWDAILREYEGNQEIIDRYVDFLRRLFKGGNSNSVFAGAYITGILPIKKYKTESALNNFTEYSVINPGKLAGYFGFTKKEVCTLCSKHNLDYSLLESWYDGYRIGHETSIFNPYSVMSAIWHGTCRNYWSETGSYESVKRYIQMNFDGLKDDIVKMLAGESCEVDPTTFQNDISIINSKNDIFTLLIHLGYLSYDKESEKCYIPNREIFEGFAGAVKETSWERLSEALAISRNLLESTLKCDERAVADGINLAHDENTSILSYNDENSLSCVLAIAYYYAKKDYIIHREFASGKGFADMVLIPRKGINTPAMVIELKIDKNIDTALEQIKHKNYVQKVAEYTNDILLVGISYDRRNKKHSCKISRERPVAQ